MKARFKNIGPIKEADLDLGDLTIIAGQNNTGKTLLVYTLYGFLDFFKERGRFPSFFFGDRILPEHDILDWVLENRTVREAIRQIKNTGEAVVRSEEFNEIDKGLAAKASAFFSSDLLEKVFSASNGEFRNASFHLEKEYGNNAIEKQQFFLHQRGRRWRLAVDCRHENGEIAFNLHSLADTREPPPSSTIIGTGITSLLLQACIHNGPIPFILSAERFGISLFYKELDFTKSRLVEELQNLPAKDEFDPFDLVDRLSARYTKPIANNMDFTRGLSGIRKKKSNLLADDFRSVRKIMGGYYKVSNDEIRFISSRRGEKGFDIPLHLASSSARGLLDLHFYLNYVAEPGQILIVDEPESQLSPTNQIMMARLLVFCVNSGLKVLVTTHSDYFVKEINNLIMLNSEFKGKKDFLKRNRKDYSAEDRLNPDSVKAYVCENGTLNPCVVDTTGIDMPIFDDAIDKINKISMELALRTAPDESEND